MASACPSSVAAPRVLVVDDRPAMREALHDVLELSGCQVDEAASVEQALAILATAAVEVVVVADAGGRRLIAAIRGDHRRVRIVAVCEHCARAGVCGADACLSGQFSARELMGAVRG